MTENPTGMKFWFDGFLMEVLVSAADTDGSLSVCTQTHRAGYGTPVHVHEREDQTLFVLDGTITAWLDPLGDPVERVVGAGESVFLPRGVAHAFRVEDDSELLEIPHPSAGIRRPATPPSPQGRRAPGGTHLTERWTGTEVVYEMEPAASVTTGKSVSTPHGLDVAPTLT